MQMQFGVVVQWLEHRPVKAEVAGSNPVNLVFLFVLKTRNLKYFLMMVYSLITHLLFCQTRGKDSQSAQ